MKISSLPFILIIALLAGCTAHNNIEPVGQGKFKGRVDALGPVIAAFGTQIPVPYLAVGADYGLEDNLDINGGVHIMPVFYKIAGADLGATWYPLPNDGWQPGIGLGGKLLLFSSLKADVESRFRAYPMLSASFAWKLGSGMIYTGAETVIPFTSLDYYEDSPAFILCPFVGYRWKIGKKYNLFTEIKWLGVNWQTNQLAVEYIHPADHGAIGVYLSLERSF